MIVRFNNTEERRLVRLVVRHSVATLGQLPPQQRADLLEGAALLLDGEEGDEASRAAELLRQSEAAQLKFCELIQISK